VVGLVTLGMGATLPLPVVGQTGDGVVDLALILAAGPDVALDPSGRTATISVSTTVDVACAVVYGEDETFGSLATDRDMGGQAHRDHTVLLGGLQPATRYVYRMQGSGIDGTLYRSRAYSFTTASAKASGVPNVAVGARVVAVSSEYSADYAATNAVDGDPATEWSTRGDGDAAFITIDLGRPVDVTALHFATRRMADGSAITWTFTVSVDGAAPLGPFPASEEVPVVFSGQVLRFDVDTASGGNTGATEIVVLGTGPPTG
jgi:hypothetical protein